MSNSPMQRYLQRLICDCSSLRQALAPHRTPTNSGITARRHYKAELPVPHDDWIPSPKVQDPEKLPDVDTEKRKSEFEDERKSVGRLLTRLRDPLHLANHVAQLLQRDRIDEAEKIVVAASRHMQCIVSWNHLINWRSRNGKINSAIQTYNMMKKRAQVPDAHTYTILFRNMTDHVRLPTTLPKALSIYHSMFGPNSKVKPNIIHTNAVLKVCALAHDIDALYGVIGRLEEEGPLAPDARTFTIIFNALREHMSRDPVGKLSTTQLVPLRNKVIIDARQMWADVIARWRRGDLVIDEELVCSMGRLLLLGDEQDVDEIFSLLQQTMNIARLVPKIGSAERNKIDPRQQDKGLHKNRIAEDDFKLPSESDSSSNLNGLPKPGQATLTLALQAAESTRMKSTLVNYWNYLTKICQVIPDRANYHLYLRNLRWWRAGGEAVEVLKQIPVEERNRATFKLVMSAISRDRNHLKTFEIADEVLALMHDTILNFEPSIYETYIELALRVPKARQTNLAARSEVLRNHDEKKLQVIERFSPMVPYLQTLLERIDKIPNPETTQKEELDTIVRFFKALKGVHDSVLQSETIKIDEKTRESIDEGKRHLDRILQSLLNKGYNMSYEKLRRDKEQSQRKSMIVS